MKNLIVLFLGLVLLAGCKVGKNYKGTELTVPDTYRFSENRVDSGDFLVNIDTLRLDSTLDYSWFELFKDPDLDTLIRLALTYNFDLRIAGENIVQAQRMLSNQKTELLPQFGYEGGYTRGNFQGASLSGVQNSIYGLGTVNWEIDIWGKYRRLNESARAELLATTEGYRAVQISLMATVADLYFQMLEYEALLEISNQNYVMRDSITSIIRHRFEKGYSPEIDLNQSEVQRAIAAGSIPVWERRLAQTENQLSVLTGTHPREINHSIGLLGQDTVFAIPEGLPSALLTRRPDILAAEQDMIAQNARVGAAKANRLPNISLTGVLGVASADLKGLSTNNLAWNLGGSLFGPLFYWNKYKRIVDIEQSKQQQSILAYQRTAYNAFREVDDILVAISTLKEELMARLDQRRAALRAQYLSGQRYAQGVTSYLEYLESQRQAFDAEQNYVSTRKDLLSAYAQLYKALGGGWQIP